MLSRNFTRRSPRRGAAVVEASLVLGIFFVLMFGVFEYCRFLMVLHVTNNAARDASRYASVNVGCDPDQVPAKKAEILQYAKDRMGGVYKQIAGLEVAVYPCSAPPQTVPKSLTTSKADPFNAADANNPPWNQASFTERIAVTIRGRYEPITPLILFLPKSIPIHITAMTGSEG
jgi:Flp pilus assembly protein TadG